MGTDRPAGPPDEGAPEPRLLGGRYELGHVLGFGGMAIVRQATDLRLGRTVAVKMLRGELTEAPSFQARFRREARAAAALGHPAVVGVYDAGEDVVNGTAVLYIVMEYVDGHTLRQLLRTGPVPRHRALEITADVLAALAHSHRAGIVHRDIKPANVMVTRAGAVKVMDFGVARAVSDLSTSLTQTSAVIGTAHYLSPEQARGEAADARSDVYATGCLLYELLTGRPPFEGDSAIAVAYQHVREEPQPPSVHAPSVPEQLDAIVLAALAKDPAQRYQSAEAMRSAVLRFLGGEESTSLVPTLVPPPSIDDTADLAPIAGPAADMRRRRRNLRILLAAATVVVAAGLAGFAWSSLGDDPAPGGAPRPAPVGESESGRAPGSRTPAESLEPAASSLDLPAEDDVPAQTTRPRRDTTATPERDQRQDIRDTPDVATRPPATSVPAEAPAPTPTAKESEPATTAPEETPTQSPTPEPTRTPSPTSSTTPPPDGTATGAETAPVS